MGIEIIPADTTPEAFRVQLDVFRRMPGSKRLELVCEMSNKTQRVSPLLYQHPRFVCLLPHPKLV